MDWKDVAASSCIDFTVCLMYFRILRLCYPKGSDVFIVFMIHILEFGDSLEAFYRCFCLVTCVIKWSCVLILGTVLRLLFHVYVFDFSLVTLSVLSAHGVKGVQFCDMYSTPFLGICTLVWSYVGLSQNFHISVVYCACSLAWIGASCPGRVSHPCGGCLCPCSLSFLNSVEAGAGLRSCVLGYCHCSLKKTLDVVFVLVCMLHLLFGRF